MSDQCHCAKEHSEALVALPRHKLDRLPRDGASMLSGAADMCGCCEHVWCEATAILPGYVASTLEARYVTETTGVYKVGPSLSLLCSLTLSGHSLYSVSATYDA